METWVRQCAWCQRVWVEDRWVLVPVPVGAQVTHGLCPECVRQHFSDDTFAIDTSTLVCYGRK